MNVLDQLQLNWRTVAAALLALFALLLWGSALEGPERHTNDEAGFSIEPPRAWTHRIDDPSGSRLSRRDGGAWLIITTRLTTHETGLEALEEIASRPAGGPISDVRWRRREQVAFPDGRTAALGELTQREGRRLVHAWMIVAVRGNRLFHAVAAAPEEEAEALEDELLGVLATLRFE